jgi:hypothetical protein
MLLYHQRGGILMAQVIDKKQAHDLVDQLQPEQVPAAVALLRSMVSSTEDDEPVTEEDLQRLRDVRAALARGEKGTPMEEFLTEFGLTMEDLAAKK